jgi:hypothetical protein
VSFVLFPLGVARHAGFLESNVYGEQSNPDPSQHGEWQPVPDHKREAAINHHFAQVIGVAYVAKRDAMIRVYDAAGNVIETHEEKGDFKEW